MAVSLFGSDKKKKALYEFGVCIEGFFDVYLMWSTLTDLSDYLDKSFLLKLIKKLKLKKELIL